MEFIAILLALFIVGLIAHSQGHDRGYKEGFQQGRLDQHWYQKDLEFKKRR